MIRTPTLIWFALALVTGIGLFLVKHQVQRLEDEHAGLARAVDAEHENIHVLRAEWSYLNEIKRLETLSRRHLKLRPMTAADFGAIEDLPLGASPATVDPVTRPLAELPVAEIGRLAPRNERRPGR